MVVKKEKKIKEIIIDTFDDQYRLTNKKIIILINLLALSWSLFQLASATSFLIVDSTILKSAHLTFASLLAFLIFPCFRRKNIPLISNSKNITLLDLILIAAALVSMTYIVYAWDTIVANIGVSSDYQKMLSVLVVFLVLEATRRVLGLALPGIALFFIAYVFTSAYWPGVFAYRSASLNTFSQQLVLSTSGIYGIPLGVSSKIIFLFVLFGALLEKAGAGKFFIDLMMMAFGGMRAGSAKACVVASGLMAMISGSSVANTVTSGNFTIPIMKESGYPAHKAGAIEVSASINGQIMPPLMGAAAFIMAEYVGISYSKIIVLAFIPAVFVYVSLFYMVHIDALKYNIKKIPKDKIPRIDKATIKVDIIFFIPLIIIIYSLVIARKTANTAALYSIMSVVAVIFYREIYYALKNKKSLVDGLKRGINLTYQGLISGAKGMVTVALACAVAGIIVGVVSLGLGSIITEIVAVLSRNNLFLLLLLTGFASIILGMGLPTTANYIVMATLTAPVIVALGGNTGIVIPLLAAHLFVMYFGVLADATPPVALAAYAAAGIAKADPLQTGFAAFKYAFRAMAIPFAFVLNPAIILSDSFGGLTRVILIISAAIGILVFSAAVQFYVYRKTKVYEFVILVVASFFLLVPNFIADRWFEFSFTTMYLIIFVGLILSAFVYIVQYMDMKKMESKASLQ